MRAVRAQLRRAADRDAAAADDSRSRRRSRTRSYNLSKVRIESPINGIVTRRNIEEGETVVIGTMNNAGTVLLTIADMSRHRGAGRGGRDRHPERDARPEGEDHDRRDAGQDVHRQGRRDRQQPDPGDRHVGVAGDELPGQGQGRRARSPTSGPASPAPPRSRPRRAAAGRRASRSRRPRSARWSSTRSGNIVRDEIRRPAKGRPGGDRAGAELKPGPGAQGARRRVRRQGQQGGLHAGEDRHRRREVLRGAVGRQGRRQVIVGPFSSVRELKDGAAGQGRGRDAGVRRRRSRLRTTACIQFFESRAASRCARSGEQAAIVPDRAREHRRGHVDHRRGVARPGDERVRHRRDRVGRRRRQLHDPADAGRSARRPTRTASATTRASRSRKRSAIRKFSDNIGADRRAGQLGGDDVATAASRSTARRSRACRADYINFCDLQRRARPADQPGRDRHQRGRSRSSAGTSPTSCSARSIRSTR